MQMLLLLWPTNLFTTCIGERLGRSPGSIRYKAKSLGLPTRDRAVLTRVAPKLLPALLPPEHGVLCDEENIQLGEEHLRGVATSSTATRICRTVRQLERSVTTLQLPSLHFMRGNQKTQYNPSEPRLESFRKQGWHYTKCAASETMFWTHRNGPRVSNRHKRTKEWLDTQSGMASSPLHAY